jgi:hypothetical protein
MKGMVLMNTPVHLYAQVCVCLHTHLACNQMSVEVVQSHFPVLGSFHHQMVPSLRLTSQALHQYQ